MKDVGTLASCSVPKSDSAISLGLCRGPFPHFGRQRGSGRALIWESIGMGGEVSWIPCLSFSGCCDLEPLLPLKVLLPSSGNHNTRLTGLLGGLSEATEQPGNRRCSVNVT